MKRCPKCNRKYEDDTLKFCLDDGSTLAVSMRDPAPPATEIMPRGGPTLKSSAEPTIQSYPNAGDFRPRASETRHTNPVLTAGVIAIVLLLVALVAIAAFFVFKQSSVETAKTDPISSPTPLRGSSPTVREGSTNDNSEIGSATPQTGTPLKITPSSSSVRLAVQANTYYPANAIDGKRSTAWIEGVDGPGLGEWIRFDFDREINLHRILIQPGYFKSSAVWAQNNRIATLTAYFSDGTSRDLTFTDRMDSQKVDIGSVKTKWVKFVIKSVYYGTDPDTAISEMAFEWD
jgi:F5/8 type C domain